MASRLDLIRNQIQENNPESGLLVMSDKQLLGVLHQQKYSKRDYNEFESFMLQTLPQEQLPEKESPYNYGWGQKVYKSLFGAFGEKGPLGYLPEEVRKTAAGVPQNIAEGTANLLEDLKLKGKVPESVRKGANDLLTYTSQVLAGPELVNAQQTEAGVRGVVEDPDTLAGTLAKEVGSFAVPYAGSMSVLNGIGKVIDAQKIKKFQKLYQGANVKKIKPRFPKTLAATKMLASGEIASQWVIDPETAVVGQFIGDMVGDDNEMLSNLIDYVTADKNKSVGENRVALLFDGLFLTGAIAGVIKIGGLTFRSGREMFNYFKGVKNSTTAEQKETIVETIKEAAESSKGSKTPEELVKEGGDDTPFKMFSESTKDGLRESADIIKGMFRSRGFHTPEMFKVLNQSKNAKLAWASKGEQLMTSMEKQIRLLSKEGMFKVNRQQQDKLRSDLDKFLSDPELDVTILPESMQPIAKEMRDTVDELSAHLAQSTGISPELRKEIFTNLGSYLRKTYKRFESRDWRPSQEVIEAAEDFVYKKLKNPRLKRSQGKTDDVLREEAKAEVKNILSNAKYSKNLFDFTDVLYGAKNGKTLFRERQKIAQPIRDLLGEETNPSARVFSTLKTLSEYLYDKNLMEKYYRLGKDKFFFENATGNYRYQIQGKQFGSLDGKFTNQTTYFTLVKPISTKLEKTFSDNIVGESALSVAKLVLAAKGFAQSAATVLNNITHERNLFGSAKILLNNGINPLSKDTWEAFRTVTTKIRGTGKKEYQELYNKYLRLGIVNQNARIGDFKLLMESASKTNAGKWLDQYNPLKKTYKTIEDVYVAEDDIWKIVGFEKELKTLQKAYPEKSISELENMAAEIIRNTMPTYDMIPAAIKALRFSPYGNFFSFHVERFRNIFHTYRQGWKELNSGNEILQRRGAARLGSQTLLGGGVGASTADYITGKMSGLSDEEKYHLKQLNKQDYNGDRWLWDMDKDGNIVWADLKFNDPDAPVNETIIYPIYDAIFGKGKLDERTFDQRLGQAFSKSLKEFLEPLTTETLLSEALIDRIFRNGRTEDGDYIPGWIETENPDFDTFVNNEIAAWKHIAEKLYKVGAYKNLERFQKAKAGDKDIYGVGYDVSSEKFANFTGFRFNKVDNNRLLKNMHQEFYKFNRETSNARTLMYNNIAKKETTLQDFLDNYTAANRMYYKQYVSTKNKIFHFNELIKLDKIRKQEGKEPFYNLNKAQLELVMIERNLPSIVREDFKITNPELEYFKPLTVSDEKKDIFLKMHPEISRGELNRLIREIDGKFRKLPLLELKENYSEDEMETFDRLGFVEGGLVKGIKEVPYTKNDPADRVDPYTGLSYAEQSKRVQLSLGGPLLKAFQKAKTIPQKLEYDPAQAQKTQIATTGGTYDKASKIMEDYNKYNALDYGSGIQINQARQVLKADTFEPYPQLDKAEKYGTPDYIKPEEIQRKYNFITNFSVLNVLPKVDRDIAVKKIGSLLDDDGLAVITVRSKDDVLKALPNARQQISDSELITARGTYQKGFTREELKDYLSGTLGKEFEVVDLPNKYKMSGVGVLIRKKGLQPSYDLAGYKSALEEEAILAQKQNNFKTGQQLVNYLRSPKRQGISQEEIAFVDFDELAKESNNFKDWSPFDVIKSIQERKPKIYRIERREDAPYYSESNQEVTLKLDYDEAMSKELTLEEKNRAFEAYKGELIYFSPAYKKRKFNENNIEHVRDYIDTTRIYKNDLPNFNVINNKGKIIDKKSVQRLGEYQALLDDGLKLKPIIQTEKDAIEFANLFTDREFSLPDIPYKVYTTIGENTGSEYKIIGNDRYKYTALKDGEIVDDAAEVAFDEAQIVLQKEARVNGDVDYVGEIWDEPYREESLLGLLRESQPSANVTDKELLSRTLPTKYGGFSGFRLPVGGARNYREFTLHIENPKAGMKFTDDEGTKHFGGGDEIAHYRVSDRTDVDGKNVLFVEEIQSDVHAAGRKFGYKSEGKEIADFPYKKDWATFVVRDIMKLAAEGNYDRVSFINATEQLARNQKEVDIVNAITIAKAPEVSDVVKNFSKDLDDFVSKTTPKTDEDFYDGDMSTFISDLKEFLNNLKKYPIENQNAVADNIMRYIRAGNDDLEKEIGKVNFLIKYLDWVTPKLPRTFRENSGGLAMEFNSARKSLSKASRVLKLLMDDKQKYVVEKTILPLPYKYVHDFDFQLTSKELKNPKLILQREDVIEDNVKTYQSKAEPITKENLLNKYFIDEKEKAKFLKDLEDKNVPILNMDLIVAAFSHRNSYLSKIQVMDEIFRAANFASTSKRYATASLEGDGKKVIDIYNKEIPAAVSKFTKKYGESVSKESDVLYMDLLEEEGIITPEDAYRLHMYDKNIEKFGEEEAFDMLSESLENKKIIEDGIFSVPKKHNAFSVEITDEIKEAVKGGRVVSMREGGLVDQMKILGFK